MLLLISDWFQTETEHFCHRRHSEFTLYIVSPTEDCPVEGSGSDSSNESEQTVAA